MLLLALICLATGACGSSDPVIDLRIEHLVEKTNLPAQITTEYGKSIEIQGKGFKRTDMICFKGKEADFTLPIETVEYSSITIGVSERFVSGTTYLVSVIRGEQNEQIGTTTVFIIDPTSEYNVKGTVECEGAPLKNVLVSDGENFATTDDRGAYSLASGKTLGYVFVILPRGYEAPTVNGRPEFWRSFANEDPAVVEQCDFNLVRRENDNHIMVATADWHMADRLSDIEQFSAPVAAGFRKFAASASVPVYGLALGDLTWDSFWYTNSWFFPQWLNLVADSPAPLFTVIGNHDYDYKVSGPTASLDGSKAYRKYLGPIYYSMNIGKIHYIVLNNLLCKNDGTLEGRLCEETVSQEQIEWLKKDLTFVDKTTPVVLAAHAPFHRINYTRNRTWQVAPVVTNAQEVLSLLSEWDEVYILGGHRHVHNHIDLSQQKFAYAKHKMIEHTIPSLGGSLWGTRRFVSFDVNTDGMTPCYKVYEMNGDHISWYYKPIGEEVNFQFRVYDMNSVRDFWTTDQGMSTFLNKTDANKVKYGETYGWPALYGELNDNTVLINVWGGDPWMTDMKVEAYEGERRLEVRAVGLFDPLHILAYEMPQVLKNGSGPNASYSVVTSSHLFACQASSAQTTITVCVTDSFGRQYKSSMARPKKFDRTTFK